LELRNNADAPVDFDDAPALWRSAVAEGSWNASNSGGSAEYSSWMLNPQFTFASPAAATYYISLSCNFDSLNPIGFYLFRGTEKRLATNVTECLLSIEQSMQQLNLRSEFSTWRMRLGQPNLGEQIKFRVALSSSLVSE
jgi:hypothetical protein